MELSKDKVVIVERGNKVVYDCGDTIAKVFNGNKPAADIFNEALNLARAKQAGIDVPEIVEVGKVDGAWTIVTEKVEGRTMRQIGDEDVHARKELLHQFVQLQLDIHAHRAPLMSRQKDKYSRMINAASDVLDEATRYELLMRLDGMKYLTKICHGDFVPYNVIVRADGSACVCDWAHATQGNGAADCAITYLHFRMRAADELAENYLDAYCTAQGCTKSYVQNWLSIVAGAELSRGRVVEKEFLLRWVDVVDFQ